MADSPPWLSFRDIISSGADAVRDASMLEISPSLLGRWASDACKDFAGRTDTDRRTFKRNLVPSQRLYRLPANTSRVTRVAITYPGELAQQELPYNDQYTASNGYDQSVVSRTTNWSLSKDGRDVQLYPKPSLGGTETTTQGAGSASSIVLHGVDSSVDDFYNGMTLRVLTGAQMGEESVISDYVGSTRTATLTTALSGAPGSGIRVVIGQDQLVIDYIGTGSEWRDQDITAAIVVAVTSPATVEWAHDAARPLNYFAGYEIFMTSGVCAGERALITASHLKSTDLTKTLLTYEPEFLSNPEEGGVGMLPSVNDTFDIRQVPAVDSNFHQALGHYVAAMALKLVKSQESSYFMGLYEQAVSSALEAAEGEQDSEFEQVSEYAKGEDYCEDGY